MIYGNNEIFSQTHKVKCFTRKESDIVIKVNTVCCTKLIQLKYKSMDIMQCFEDQL